MIYNAKIKSISDNTLNVQIDRFGIDNTFTIASIATPPGMEYTLQAGQDILVGILNNDLSQPVLIGMKAASTSNTIDNMNIISKVHDLSVLSQAVLPEGASYIGSANADNSILVANKLSSTIDDLLVYLQKGLKGEATV